MRSCEFMYQSSQPHPACPHSQLLLDGREHTGELQKLGLDLLVTTAPIHDRDGNPVGSVHLVRDIATGQRGFHPGNGLSG